MKDVLKVWFKDVVKNQEVSMRRASPGTGASYRLGAGGLVVLPPCCWPVMYTVSAIMWMPVSDVSEERSQCVATCWKKGVRRRAEGGHCEVAVDSAQRTPTANQDPASTFSPTRSKCRRRSSMRLVGPCKEAPPPSEDELFWHKVRCLRTSLLIFESLRATIFGASQKLRTRAIILIEWLKIGDQLESGGKNLIFLCNRMWLIVLLWINSSRKTKKCIMICFSSNDTYCTYWYKRMSTTLKQNETYKVCSRRCRWSQWTLVRKGPQCQLQEPLGITRGTSITAL